MHKEREKRNGHHHQPVNEKNLLVATMLNLVITLAEFAGGVIANSLALMSDALHNLSDTFATFIAYMATIISKKKADPDKTFGYKRIEILAALLNAIILAVICFYLFKEAIHRIQEPHEVKPLVMIVIAMVGLGANVLALAIIKKDSGKSINVRAAYVHLIGDSLSSLVVIIAAVVIQVFDMHWIDPVITILIGVYLIREAYLIIKEAVNILMQATPENLNIRKIKVKVEEFPEVRNMHHLHAWNLNDKEIHFEAHVELEEDLHVSELKPIQKQIEHLLEERFNIHHSTLQFEFRSGHNNKMISNQE